MKMNIIPVINAIDEANEIESITALFSAPPLDGPPVILVVLVIWDLATMLGFCCRCISPTASPSRILTISSTYTRWSVYRIKQILSCLPSLSAQFWRRRSYAFCFCSCWRSAISEASWYFIRAARWASTSFCEPLWIRVFLLPFSVDIPPRAGKASEPHWKRLIDVREYSDQSTYVSTRPLSPKRHFQPSLRLLHADTEP